jgi:hypothetical protein
VPDQHFVMVDLSRMADCVEYYLRHGDERDAIAGRARLRPAAAVHAGDGPPLARHCRNAAHLKHTHPFRRAVRARAHPHAATQPAARAVQARALVGAGRANPSRAGAGAHAIRRGACGAPARRTLRDRRAEAGADGMGQRGLHQPTLSRGERLEPQPQNAPGEALRTSARHVGRGQAGG